MVPGYMNHRKLNAEGRKAQMVAIGLLGHLLTFTGNPHHRGYWRHGWACSCGLDVRFDEETGEYLPKG